MVDQDKKVSKPQFQSLSNQVGQKEVRKIRARRHRERSIWFGLGTFGMIGWSVAIPTLIGTALGVWIDKQWPSGYSWTLMLMLGGLLLGCLNAWYWLNFESRLIEGEEENDESKNS
jgi:ATP synthase protein I